MSPETIFRWLFGAVFLGVLLAALYGARAAKRVHGAEIAQARNEIPWIFRARAALGIVFYVFLIDWLFFEALPDTTLPLPMEVRWVGSGTLLLAVALLWWTHLTLGANYHGPLGLHEEHELVTSGPYRWVRHPIYAIFVLLMVGLLAMTTDWVIGLSGIVLTATIALGRATTEEEQLLERFGDRYRSYRERTPRFVPWPAGRGEG